MWLGKFAQRYQWMVGLKPAKWPRAGETMSRRRLATGMPGSKTTQNFAHSCIQRRDPVLVA